MLPPAIIAVFALLTGGSFGAAAGTYGATTVAVVKDEAVVAEIYADLPFVCGRTLPALHDFVRANPKAKDIARIAAVTDAICVAAKRPDNPISQALLILDAMRALKDVDARLDPTPEAPPSAAPVDEPRPHAGPHH